MKQLAGIQLHESIGIAPATEYNVGDEIIIGGKWYDITAIEDGHYWIADEDGKEGEFNPGSEDSHTPVQEQIVEEPVNKGTWANVSTALYDAIAASPNSDALAQSIEDFYEAGPKRWDRLANGHNALADILEILVESSDARPGADVDMR